LETAGGQKTMCDQKKMLHNNEIICYNNTTGDMKRFKGAGLMESIHDLIQYFFDVPHDADTDKHLSQQLRRIMDWMPGGFFIYRANEAEELIYANEAVLRLFLCDTMEELRILTGNSFRGVVHPDDLDMVENSIRKQISTNQTELDYVEYRIIRKDGSVRWINDYGHFIHCEKGDVFCVFIVDNTEERQRRIQREKSLQNRMDAYYQELEGMNEESLRRLEVIEGLSADYESIFYVNLDASTIQPYQLSFRLESLFEKEGHTRKYPSFVCDYIKNWVYPQDQEALRKFLSPDNLRSKLADLRMHSVDYRLGHGDDVEYFQLQAVSAGRDGQIVMGVRSVDAFVRRSLMQREVLENALHQANSAVIAKNTFLANMSHDMRTPMNAILGYTTLVRKHLDDKNRANGYLNMIESACSQLLQLVNEVLEIARIESGKVQLEESVCDLREIAKRVYACLETPARKKELDLSVDTGHLEHNLVFCDEKKLEQFLTILADNAVKYTPAKGSVNIIIEELEGGSPGYRAYRVAVTDNGIGIGSEFLKRIFTPFERQENTTSSSVPGTGLGLSIAMNLSNMMGGKLQAESTQGEGSCFFSVFIFREAEPTPAPDEIKKYVISGGKILLVEDNELNIEIEQELLEGEGYVVDVAEDGSKAVNMIKNSQPGEYALVFMDIQMPVMDGYQATRAIRALNDPVLSRIPIVAVSANAFDEDKRKSSACGMNDHIPKPVELSQLVRAIQCFTQLRQT